MSRSRGPAHPVLQGVKQTLDKALSDLKAANIANTTLEEKVQSLLGEFENVKSNAEKAEKQAQAKLEKAQAEAVSEVESDPSVYYCSLCSRAEHVLTAPQSHVWQARTMEALTGEREEMRKLKAEISSMGSASEQVKEREREQSFHGS